jgi:hypothetical protein
MSVETTRTLVSTATLYLLAGLVFAIPFAWRWVGRLDPAAQHGTWGFRLLIVPGVTVFWPYLLARLVRGASAPPDEWNAHRARAKERVS